MVVLERQEPPKRLSAGRPVSAFRLAATMLLLAGVCVPCACSWQEIPIQVPFRLKDNLVFVTGSVDGTPAQIVIDSGTGGIVVDRAYASRIGLSQGKFLGNAAGAGRATAPLFSTSLRTISAGRSALGPVDAYTLDERPFSRSAGAEVDAIFGYQFLKDRIVSIDYRRNIIAISRRSVARYACPDPLPFVLLHGVPVLTAKASFDGDRTWQTLRLVVDLGTRHHTGSEMI